MPRFQFTLLASFTILCFVLLSPIFAAAAIAAICLGIIYLGIACFVYLLLTIIAIIQTFISGEPK